MTARPVGLAASGDQRAGIRRQLEQAAGPDRWAIGLYAPAWHKSQAGFRIDWSRAGDSLTVNGNGYEGTEGQPLPGVIALNPLTLPLGNISISGANLTVRWNRALEAGSSPSLPGYYDRTQCEAPSRVDRDAHVPAAPPFLLAGGPDYRSEVANVYEIGYRGQPAARLSYSLTVFHTDYDHLRSQETAPSGTFAYFSNQMQGNTTGIETSGAFQAAETWRLSAGLSALRDRLTPSPGSTDTLDENLFYGGHAEFTDPMTRTQFGQVVFFKVVCRV